MPFELLNSEILMKGRAFVIRRDLLKTPDGRETKFDIIEHRGSVVVIPVNENGDLLFVRQYRHAAGKELLELPAGSLEENEDPAICAAREIREETGFAAGNLQKIGEFYLAPGYSSELMIVFLATDLAHDPLEADADEFLSVDVISLAKALDMARNGEMPDSKSLAALLLAMPYLKK